MTPEWGQRGVQVNFIDWQRFPNQQIFFQNPWNVYSFQATKMVTPKFFDYEIGENIGRNLCVVNFIFEEYFAHWASSAYNKMIYLEQLQ